MNRRKLKIWKVKYGSAKGSEKTFESVHTFIVGMDGPDVPFEMLAAVETFSAAFDFAYVQTRVLRVALAGGLSTDFGGDSTATAFLGEVGDGCRQYDA
jgi:hypothetical protein